MIAHVALPLPIDKTFSYTLPNGMAPFTKPFARVRVPFNNRSLVAFVLDKEEQDDEGLKAVQDLVDCVPLIDTTCARLCQWASSHYVTPIGLTLKYALSSSIKMEKYCNVKAKDPSVSFLDGVPLAKAYALAGKEPILDYLNRSLIALCDVFTGRELQVKGSGEPKVALRKTLYLGRIEDRRELYVSVVAGQLERQKNVLMLLPDHHVVGDFFYRSFAATFPGAVLWFHSTMTEKRRAETYFRARSEGGHLILGSRSAVFLPITDNGLIIVERPEEDEYRNEEAFKFNAVRLAVKRAEMEGIPLVLGSAAPPVEAMWWADEGAIDIRSGREAESPSVSRTRSERGKGREGHLPEAFVRSIRDVADRGGIVVVHTPRRAYASMLYCGVCGQMLLCPTCKGASLNYNKGAESLTCNTCKEAIPYEERCSHCGSPFIRFLDVGTEYVEARLREALPGNTVLRITGEADGQRDLRSLRMGVQKGAIIVGTNVLSKLYGIRADVLILYGWEDFLRMGGYRAREKMFQVFTNLVDALRPKDLILHTYGKEPFDISLFLDRKRFYKDELEKRKKADFPPFVRLFLLNIVKRNERAGQRVIKAIDKLVDKEHFDHQMLGPIDVKGHYGWKVILKGDELSLTPLLTSLYRLPGIHIEADPLYL